MSAPAAVAVTAWAALVAAVAHAFTAPGFAVFACLVDGWVLAPGRRTITRIITTIDAEGRRAHDAYHRCDTRSHTTSEMHRLEVDAMSNV